MASPLRRFPFYPGRKPEQFADRLGTVVELRLFARLGLGQNAHLLADDFWEAGGAAVALPAGGQSVSVTAPAGAVGTLVALAAGLETVTSSAPAAAVATLVGLAAGVQAVSVTAGAATPAYALAAGTQVATLSAPSPTLSMLTVLLPGVAQALVMAPTAIIPGSVEQTWGRLGGRIIVRCRKCKHLSARLLRSRSRR
jgi:hypothetical protein